MNAEQMMNVPVNDMAGLVLHINAKFTKQFFVRLWIARLLIVALRWTLKCDVFASDEPTDADMWRCDCCGNFFADSVPREGFDCDLCPMCVKSLADEATS